MRIVVVGGGISGLCAAYYASRVGRCEVVVLEKQRRLGGWIETRRFDDGCIFELGPRSVRPAGEAGLNTLQLLEELDLLPQVLALTRRNPHASKRYILANDSLVQLPPPGALFRGVSPFRRSLLGYALKEWRTKPSSADDESVFDFFSRRFGPEVAEFAADPLCRGIFAGDCRKLSVRSALPVLYDAERQSGSVLRHLLRRRSISTSGYSEKTVQLWRQTSSFSLMGGLQTLVESLEKRLGSLGVAIHRSTPVDAIQMEGAPVVTVAGEQIKADRVIVACAPQDVASLLPPLRPLLANLQSASVLVANYELEGALPIQGFGFLVPSTENPSLLGVTFDSNLFVQHNRRGMVTSRITAMLGGAWPLSPQLSTADDILSVLRHRLGLSGKLLRAETTFQERCITQFHVGHYKLLEELEAAVKGTGLVLLGAGLNHISVNDSIWAAKKAIHRILLSK